MAAKTTTQSGLASAGSTWVGGVAPVNGDGPLNINHDVTWDIDCIGSGITLTDDIIIASGKTLAFSTTPGSYSIKMSGTSGHDIHSSGGTGTLRAGTSATPYPATCSAIIDLNGASKVLSALDINAQEPTNYYVKLLSNAALSATELSVDRDVTADAPWLIAGAKVWIGEETAVEGEEYTIASITATTITLTGGLSAAKDAGAYVMLLDRNVRIINNSGVALQPVSGGRFVGSIYTASAAIGIGSWTGGYIRAAIRPARTSGGQAMSGCIGCDAKLAATGHRVLASNEACIFDGLVLSAASFVSYTQKASRYAATFIAAGFENAAYGDTGGIVSGRWVTAGTKTLWDYCHDVSYFGGTFTGSTVISATSRGTHLLYGCTLSGTVAVPTVRATPTARWSFDHNAVTGAVAGWMSGATAADDATTPSPAANTPLRWAFTDATFSCPLDIPICGYAGKAIAVQASVKQSTTGMVWPLRLQLLSVNDNSVLAQTIIAENTDWQTLTLNYTPAYTRLLTLRIVSQNSSGNIWLDYRGMSGVSPLAKVTVGAGGSLNEGDIANPGPNGTGAAAGGTLDVAEDNVSGII